MKSNISIMFLLILLFSLEFSHQAFESVIAGSLKDYKTFVKYLNYLYAKGTDHNGSALIYGSSTDHSQIYLEKNKLP